MVKIRLSQGTWTTHGETGVLCQRPLLTPAQHLSGGCVQRLEEGDVWALRTCLYSRLYSPSPHCSCWDSLALCLCNDWGSKWKQCLA